MSPYTKSPEAVETARLVIRRLLDGGDPDGTPAENCGAYHDDVMALYDAHADGGTEKVRAAFNALAKDDPSLIRLTAGAVQDRKTRWTVAELYDTEFPEPAWAVPDLIPVGLCFLAGRPKVGKSWLALQIAHAVGTGGMVLDRSVEKGSVLFLALEDTPRRLKQRQETQKIPRSADITFATTWSPLTERGVDDLIAEVTRHKYNLVVLDTLSRSLGHADQMDLAQMTIILSKLQELSHTHDLALLVVDHHRKQSGYASDPVDDILGSTAKGAVPDSTLGLYYEQGKKQATLKARGRDVEEIELVLQWDALLCCWQLLGEAGQVRKDSAQAQVQSAIGEIVEMGRLPTTTEIAKHLKKSSSQISRDLGDMQAKGAVIKGEKVGRQVPYYTPKLLPDRE